MLHPRFMDIVREIYKRDMFIDELNTNGYFITQEILDEFNAVGCRPMIKISFDGIGCHDWMRDRKGAEARTLDAIELCTRNGFNVMSQTQVHRRNLDSLMPTARKLNDIGVSTMRLIRTTEAPRWEKNSPGSCLGIEEYYAVMLDFMRAYKDSGMQMNVIAWQLMSVYPADKTYSLASVMFGEDEYKPSAPIWGISILRLLQSSSEMVSISRRRVRMSTSAEKTTQSATRANTSNTAAEAAPLSGCCSLPRSGTSTARM